MCIDICPVGALTSGAYRYKTRPWEMKHVATICTHCGDGCTTTLGVRPNETGMEIVRGTNRDKSGSMGISYASKDAMPSISRPSGTAEATSRSAGMAGCFRLHGKKRLTTFAGRLREVRDNSGGSSIGVIGSTRTTNEENYFLQKLARIGPPHQQHRSSSDGGFPRSISCAGNGSNSTASMKEVLTASAILLIGNDPTYQHPLLAWQIRNNVRLHHAHFYVINARPIKLTRQATMFFRVEEGSESTAVDFLAGDDSARDRCANNQSGRDQLTDLRDKLRAENDLVIVFGSEMRGKDIAALVQFAAAIPGCKLVSLGDYANSRGAADMGLYPDLLPGYTPLSKSSLFRETWDAEFPTQPGLNLLQMIEAAKEGSLKALYVVGSNPVARYHIDPFRSAGSVSSSPGSVPHRDGPTGGRRASYHMCL